MVSYLHKKEEVLGNGMSGAAARTGKLKKKGEIKIVNRYCWQDFKKLIQP